MGKVNVKLLQGIEDTEGQINKEKQMPGDNRSKSDVKEKQEALKNSSEMEERSQEVMPENQTEPFKTKVPEKKVASESSKAKATQNKTDRKQVFSFRAAVSNINVWKSFATATGRTMESIGTDAMNEYMKKQRLSDEETAVLKALLAKYEGR